MFLLRDVRRLERSVAGLEAEPRRLLRGLRLRFAAPADELHLDRGATARARRRNRERRRDRCRRDLHDGRYPRRGFHRRRGSHGLATERPELRSYRDEAA